MKTQQVHIPKMVLYGQEVSNIPLYSYPDKEFSNDEFWSGGAYTKTYTWSIIVNISSQTHSSNATPSIKLYNGLDVFTGMWISDVAGNSLRIDSVNAKTPTMVEIVVTDVDRVNTFSDSEYGGDGNGFFKSRQLIIFSLDDDNMPIIPFLPPEVKTPSLPSFISSRFQTWNPNRRYRIDKPNHGFTNNDVIVLNQETHQYEKSSNNNTKHPVIGTVIETYPNKFFISPINRIVSNTMPALCGNIGDYIYADPTTGKFTNTPSNNRLFIKLTESKKSHVTSIKDVGELTIGNKLKVNGVEYTVTSDIDTLVSEINQDIDTHFINTVKKAGSTNAINTRVGQAYGVVGAILPVSAKVNGVLVNFTTDTSGSVTFGASGMADVNDIIQDINSANIDGIVLSTAGSDLLTISNTLGGDIIIENVTNDGGGTPFAGVASCTGLPLETISTGSTFRIYMERLDGGDITLENIIGKPIEDMGLFSVQNGQLPDGMIVENWNRVGETYVVDNMVARDNIFPILTGDTVLVLDQGNGEWIKYMFVNGEYIVTATQDSARTDATTLSLTLTPDTVLKSKIGTVSDGSRITLVTVEVITPFDEDTILDIGDDYNDDSLLGDNYVDLGSKSIYQNNTAVVYNHGTDVDLFANFDSGISTVGEARILISYM